MKAMEYCDGCKLARMAVDGIQNLPHRFATDTCDGWRKRKSGLPILTRDKEVEE